MLMQARTRAAYMGLNTASVVASVAGIAVVVAGVALRAGSAQTAPSETNPIKVVCAACESTREMPFNDYRDRVDAALDEGRAGIPCSACGECAAWKRPASPAVADIRFVLPPSVSTCDRQQPKPPRTAKIATAAVKY